ncbi:uncharacterized protein SPPG_06113 [Spizellomyces punctatus DAOM BR117]|uniref:Uncharacterized protein n=1 Tax=Spizellomyces punctatus (strain DAOM BR117) TaxID=645134 RepID=A0A0L0HC00_SPIPD|nr:uncharacterized protein SPPG_06113 [Spizellomyces punctatus DAOM BR117]KNC98409.1 hypothetical protein SPPG_06113 [Spizellomyces punctatus DAOM BR117]|eukprot:XP_016606449.1 hypothetical protein SPPG_06113 [Spizellomyces punctatus DAOM BR117]
MEMFSSSDCFSQQGFGGPKDLTGLERAGLKLQEEGTEESAVNIEQSDSPERGTSLNSPPALSTSSRISRVRSDLDMLPGSREIPVIKNVYFRDPISNITWSDFTDETTTEITDDSDSESDCPIGPLKRPGALIDLTEDEAGDEDEEGAPEPCDSVGDIDIVEDIDSIGDVGSAKIVSDPVAEKELEEEIDLVGDAGPTETVSESPTATQPIAVLDENEITDETDDVESIDVQVPTLSSADEMFLTSNDESEEVSEFSSVMDESPSYSDDTSDLDSAFGFSKCSPPLSKQLDSMKLHCAWGREMVSTLAVDKDISTTHLESVIPMRAWRKEAIDRIIAITACITVTGNIEGVAEMKHAVQEINEGLLKHTSDQRDWYQQLEKLLQDLDKALSLEKVPIVAQRSNTDSSNVEERLPTIQSKNDQSQNTADRCEQPSNNIGHIEASVASTKRCTFSQRSEEPQRQITLAQNENERLAKLVNDIALDAPVSADDKSMDDLHQVPSQGRKRGADDILDLHAKRHCCSHSTDHRGAFVAGWISGMFAGIVSSIAGIIYLGS